jgi:predicted DNA-binding transcriptional regulator AlpA
MSTPDKKRTRGFGEAVGWYRHEIVGWVYTRVRAGTRMPAFAAPEPPETPELIRWPEVERITSLKRWTAWDMERRGKFPQRVLLSAGTTPVDGQPSK